MSVNRGTAVQYQTFRKCHILTDQDWAVHAVLY